MDPARYSVTANRLNLRSEPGVDSGVLAVLANGTLVIPSGDLEPAWWQVTTLNGVLNGFVARRYLAPVSTSAPVVPTDIEGLLWSLTTRAEGRVRYELGAKHSQQGKIDCSGWVCELTQAAFVAANAAAVPEVVFERADLGALVNHSDGIVSGIERRTGFVSHGLQVTLEALRPGMLIGCDFGDHKWERSSPPRVYGIDHIVQVVRDPNGGMWISQSSSSGGGVNRQPLAEWLSAPTQAGLRAKGQMHAVDPFLMADRNTRFVALSGAVRDLAQPKPTPAPSAAVAAANPQPAAAGGVPTVSQAAFDLIVQFEVSGRAHYERKLVHPIWPGLKSGVTIGIGHDLAHTTPAEFDRNWAGLPPRERERLRETIGKSGSAARDCIRSLSDIVVPWPLAEAVYRNVDVPRTAAATAGILPHCDKLSADCFGVLVSLGYNRGLSYRRPRTADDAKDRYKEMRAILSLMEKQEFALIPAQIRAMSRIWRGTEAEAGLSRRREAEAALFEVGLCAPPVTEIPLPAGEEPEHAPLLPETVSAAADDEGFDNTEVGNAIARAQAPLSDDASAQADLVARSQVIWASDDKSVDYAHLQALLPAGTRFSLRAEDLERLCTLNGFPAEGNGERVLFGLRGCGIISAGEDFASEVVLIDRRPDHQSARCVMGVWDRSARTIAVFPASTVPNAKAVAGWQRTRKAGNLLPTGFYRYITGNHNGRPGCLLLRKSVSEFRTVVVRRSANNLRYERTDIVDVCAPGDNIHPSFFQVPDDFSSFGCQVVVGLASRAGVHSGPWAKFRAAAGLQPSDARDGQPFCYVLLTGAEANLASALRRSGKGDGAAEWESLRRLRFGSQGEAVVRLQTALGLPDPDGSFGPNTAKRLHSVQAERFEGKSDGICTPDLAKAAGWNVF
jgi:hypothetical protein